MTGAANAPNLFQLLLYIPFIIQSQQTPPFKSSVAFALDVLKAVQSKNYEGFFHLYRGAPDLSGYLLDYFVHSMRTTGLESVLKSFMSLPLTVKSLPLFIG